MVVAMAFVRMMQVAVHEVIGVIPMGHCFVTAAGAMHMAGWMAAAQVFRRADSWIALADLDLAFVGVIAVHGVKTAIMEVVDVIPVADCGVTASFPVDMLVIGVDPMLSHS